MYKTELKKNSECEKKVNIEMKIDYSSNYSRNVIIWHCFNVTKNFIQ